MSQNIETVRVRTDNKWGYKVINLCDKKDQDEIYHEKDSYHDLDIQQQKKSKKKDK